MTTLLPPTAGQASVAGYDIVREASAGRQRIGYVPQMLSADPDLTGFENLLIFAKLYRVPAMRRLEITQTLAIAETELRKLRHDPVELLTRVVQPILWLLIFGQVMGRVNAIPTGGLRYSARHSAAASAACRRPSSSSRLRHADGAAGFP